MNRFEPTAPEEALITTWHNPTDHEMYVDVYVGSGVHKNNERRATRYRFPKHADTQVPSQFDNAIQLIQCGMDECRQHGTWCAKGHRGTVVGGSCPQLQKKGTEGVAGLLPCLNPMLAQEIAAAAEVASQDLARRKAEDAMMLARKRQQDASDALLDAQTRNAAAAANAAADLVLKQVAALHSPAKK